MDSRCIRCERSLGKNSEVEHLPIGRRIAFDTVKGRLWVICNECDQWNLVPIEERWEALAECDHLASTAEAKATSSAVSFAQTTSGLELIRVGGMAESDISNWRYGRRMAERQRQFLWIAGSLVALAVALGLRAAIASESAGAGIYASLIAGAWFIAIWRNPPRLRPIVANVGGNRIRIWPWQRREVRIDDVGARRGPTVVIPGKHDRQFEGLEAVQLLSALLPQLNGADCATASVQSAVAEVTRAEKRETAQVKSHRRKHSRRTEPVPERPLRPWERLIQGPESVTLVRLTAERRLALEMAIAEELEHQELTQEAQSAGIDWTAQEEIAAIADSLVLPEFVQERLQRAKPTQSKG